MKRERDSTQKGNKEGDNFDHKQIEIPDCSITDLPRPIIVDILLKLSVKSILICKWVCKDWCIIISDPQFAKLHSGQAEPCALLRALDSTHLSTSLFDLDAKLNIPLPICDPEGPNGVKRKRYIRVRPEDQKFKIVNSCNGFLCLSKQSCNEPVVVCNPVTGEYINLPVAKRVCKKTRYFVDCGFGFGPRTCQYKVIRMFERRIGARARGMISTNTPATGWINYSRGIEIYTLGARSWKSIGDAPFFYSKLAFPTYLEGFVHWLICVELRCSDYIVSFSFDNEQLQLFPSPPCECYKYGEYGGSSMGVLEGCLCVCDASSYYSIDIWVMKKYGVRKSWTKMFSIDNQPHQRWPHGLYQPIHYLKSGALLMFHLKCALICYDPERPKFKYLKIRGVKSKFEAIAYIPSFISLKEAIVGDNVVVLNISSRCAGFEVHGETRTLSLAEEDGEMEFDSDCWSPDNEWKEVMSMAC